MATATCTRLRWSLLMLALALVAHHAAARPHRPDRRLSDKPPVEQPAERVRFIVVLKNKAVPDDETVAKAAQKILSEIVLAAPTVNAASPIVGVADPSPSDPDATFVDTVGDDPDPTGGPAVNTTNPEEPPLPPILNGSTTGTRGRGILAFVVEASNSTAERLRGHPSVAAAFPDFNITMASLPSPAAANVIPANATACQMPSVLSFGIPAYPLPTFRWAGCVRNNKLVYIGQRCGTPRSGIEYTALIAVTTAGKLARYQNRPCILLPDTTMSLAWNRQRFGGACRRAPTMMSPNSMPTTVCTGPSIASGYPCASIGVGGKPTTPMTLSSPVECGSETAMMLTYTGSVCGTDGTTTLVQWTKATTPGGCELTLGSGPAGDVKWAADYFGSCGVPPAASNEKVFAACGVATAPKMPRKPLASGELVPIGIDRLEVVKTVAGVRTVPDGAVWDELPDDRKVIVGVVDSGIDSTHPDLRDGYMGGRTYLKVNVTKDPRDADGGVDPIGHGTNIAGVIAAANNGRGVFGISPGVRTFSLKVVSASGSGALSYVLSAVKWVATEGVRMGIRVLNISIVLGVDATSPYYADAYNQVCAYMEEARGAGVVIVNSAGNDGRSIVNYLPTACPTVVAVTALWNPPNATAPYSNYLPTTEPVASRARVIAAPGYADQTTAPLSYTNGYVSIGGTSLAAPHVAGVFANCIMAGACTGDPMDMLATIQQAASTRAPQPAKGYPKYGFPGDASSTVNGKYYGWLVWNEF